MTIMVSGVLNPDNRLIENITVGATAVAPPAGGVAVYVNDAVSTRRKNEILNGLRWIFNGVRDRGLLEPRGGFVGQPMYSAAGIDNLTEANRRTASDVAFFNTDDIGIGWSPEATGYGWGGVIPHETAVGELIDTLQRELMKL